MTVKGVKLSDIRFYSSVDDARHAHDLADVALPGVGPARREVEDPLRPRLVDDARYGVRILEIGLVQVGVRGEIGDAPLAGAGPVEQMDVMPVRLAHGAHDGRYNVLLMGGDSGIDRWGLRPDSLSVASIDEDTGKTVHVGGNIGNALIRETANAKAGDWVIAEVSSPSLMAHTPSNSVVGLCTST